MGKWNIFLKLRCHNFQIFFIACKVSNSSDKVNFPRSVSKWISLLDFCVKWRNSCTAAVGHICCSNSGKNHHTTPVNHVFPIEIPLSIFFVLLALSHSPIYNMRRRCMKAEHPQENGILAASSLFLCPFNKTDTWKSTTRKSTQKPKIKRLAQIHG